MDSTDSARVVNSESANSPCPAGLLQLVMHLGGCWLPPDSWGGFSLNVWGNVFLGGRDEKTLRKWVSDYAIPHCKAGHQMIVDVADMRRCLPQSEIKPPKRAKKPKR